MIEHNLGYDSFYDECHAIVYKEVNRLADTGENETLRVALSVLLSRCYLVDNMTDLLDSWYLEYLAHVRQRALANEKTTFRRD